MKVVVLEAANHGKDMSWEALKEFGDAVIYDNTSKEEISKRTSDADIVIVNKSIIDYDTIGTSGNIKLICEAATGYNNIDIDYCKSRNITVCNVVGYSTESVAQHTFALLFSIYEKIAYYNKFVKSGKYSEGRNFTHLDIPFHELSGKCWGIIGLGNIGRRVADIATAFGCKIICYSASGSRYNSEYTQVELEELLDKSDIISIHAPLNSYTKELINYENICKMKKSAIIINVGRGPIVNTDDLVRALKENKIGGAGLDVFETEPFSKKESLLDIEDDTKLILTPHIAWGTVEARSRLIDEVIMNIRCYLDGELRNVVI